jgi:transketolase
MSQAVLPLRIQLAPTPANDPHFSVPLASAVGQTLDVADPRALRALIALMDMEAQLGGAASHFGGPSAFAEVMSVFHAQMFFRARRAGAPWYELFHFVNDAGHCENGLYALKALYGFADLTFEKLKDFRSIKSVLTGHGEAHLFPEGVWISNGPLGSGLPQAQGLAMGDALLARQTDQQRVTVTAISDGGCMEGEAREALAAIPGLAARGRLAPFVMIISDNNTKLTGRIDEEAFSMSPSFSALGAMGWQVIKVDDGHSLVACDQALHDAIERAKKSPKQPVAIHLKTIKGYGTKKTAESSSGAHGFPLKAPSELPAFLQEIYSARDGSAPTQVPESFLSWAQELIDRTAAAGAAAPTGSATPASSGTAAKPAIPSEKVQVGISQAMIEARKKGLPVVSISADLPGSTGVHGFQKEFPNFTQDVGVAESNMISAAIGLSKTGFIPVVDTFAQFGATKGALPLIMSALSQGPMIAVFSHIGFQDAADGASHQALNYIAMLSSIPHTDVVILTSSDEAKALMTEAIESFAEARNNGDVPHSTVFFLGRENFPRTYLPRGYSYRIGQAQIVFDNTVRPQGPAVGTATIVAGGALLHQALEAAYVLEKENFKVAVVNPSIINRPDTNTVRSCLRNTQGHLVTVDDHQVMGGMGSILVHALAQEGVPFRVRSLGVRGEFGQSAYNAIDLYRKHGLDAFAIAKVVREFNTSTASEDSRRAKV